jgi:CxxC-x17-CxxC domain-containing protein
MGHQYINQMDEIVRDAVFGNVGTMVVFRVGAEDAEFLEREFSPEFTAEDLVNLSKYNVYLKLMIDGVASHPFSAQTVEPPTPLKDSNRERIINASRSTYAIGRQIVEDNITAWTGNLNDANTQKSATPAKPSAPSGKLPAKEVKLNPLGNPEPEQQKLYDAVCAMCGKATKVIFEPKEGRKVYCKSCLKKMKNAEAEKSGASENSSEKKEGTLKPLVQPETLPTDAQDLKIENVKFGPLKNAVEKNGAPSSVKPKRKEINLADLKKALDESLKNKEVEVSSEGEVVDLEPEGDNNVDDKGVLNPGEKIDL